LQENSLGLLIKVIGNRAFDTFSKDGKTSFAFGITFQSFDRTLTDVETNAIMEKVYEAVKSKGWEVR
jgi:phenylalanyl-tRNA synthetase beta subunit